MIPARPALRLLTTAILLASAPVDAQPALSTRALLASVAWQAPAVTTCADSGAGSLRDALLHAANQDIVSLAALTCSKITLSGQLSVAVDELEIQGNGITLDGNGTDRVLAHGGTGLLTLSDITLQNGFYPGPFGGGCIYSAGQIQLRTGKVSNCTLYTTGDADGGGIFARHGVIIGSSVLSDSHAISRNGIARGGGAYSQGDIVVAFDSTSISGSTISGNSASAPGNSVGGALFSKNFVEIDAATLSGNSAYQCGAVCADSVSIGNSTLSGNSSQKFGVVIARQVSAFASTITANVTQNAKYGAGVYAVGDSSIINTIIAGNLTSANTPAIDLAKSPGSNITFSHSLVARANFTLPDSVLRSDPKLGPLAFNGGRTKTHALLAGSPAINAAGVMPYIDFDQRGRPFARTVGPAPDIGAVESSDRLFFDGFDP